jgi:CBS-domain-containing membrane protein
MWNRNCGILPVVNNESKVIGVITDRDICIALGTRNRLAGEITVNEVFTRRLFACKPEDDIRMALATMAQERVRRLPVVDDEGKLFGILSMDDVVLHAQGSGYGRTPELSYENAAVTLKRLYRRVEPEIARKSGLAA